MSSLKNPDATRFESSRCPCPPKVSFLEKFKFPNNSYMPPKSGMHLSSTYHNSRNTSHLEKITIMAYKKHLPQEQKIHFGRSFTGKGSQVALGRPQQLIHCDCSLCTFSANPHDRVNCIGFLPPGLTFFGKQPATTLNTGAIAKDYRSHYLLAANTTNKMAESVDSNNFCEGVTERHDHKQGFEHKPEIGETKGERDFNQLRKTICDYLLWPSHNTTALLQYPWLALGHLMASNQIMGNTLNYSPTNLLNSESANNLDKNNIFPNFMDYKKTALKIEDETHENFQYDTSCRKKENSSLDSSLSTKHSWNLINSPTFSGNSVPMNFSEREKERETSFHCYQSGNLSQGFETSNNAYVPNPETEKSKNLSRKRVGANCTVNKPTINEDISAAKDKKSHRCMYCGKLYSRKYGLKIHIRTHTGYKPLKCKVCGRPFGDPSNLNKHVRLHAEGETPYRCEFCGKVLVRRRDLERHIKSRHPEQCRILFPENEMLCPPADPRLWTKHF